MCVTSEDCPRGPLSPLRCIHPIAVISEERKACNQRLDEAITAQQQYQRHQ